MPVTVTIPDRVIADLRGLGRILSPLPASLPIDALLELVDTASTAGPCAAIEADTRCTCGVTATPDPAVLSVEREGVIHRFDRRPCYESEPRSAFPSAAEARRGE